MVIEMDLLPKPHMPEEARDKLSNILVGIEHKSFSQAAIADVVDVLPIVGDVSNAIRTSLETNEMAKNRQKLDFMVGVLPPPIGDVLDVLTPTNTMNYCLLHPPLMPPIRKFKNRRL